MNDGTVTVYSDDHTVSVSQATVDPYVPYEGEYSVEPSHDAQTLQTAGKVMGSDVSVGAIPSGLVDVSSTTAERDDVAEGKVFFDSTGTQRTGRLSLHEKTLDDPILFFDYDGTLVASYTEPPSELPPVPTHDRLCNGVWNYTLEDIEAEWEIMGQAYVGANYETVSGATEIDIELEDENWLSPWLKAYGTNVTIDWGDGTVETFAGSLSNNDYNHTYSRIGSYTILVSRENMGGDFLNSFGGQRMLLNENSTSEGANWFYRNAVREIRFGNHTGLNEYAVRSLYKLKAVSISPTITSYSGSPIISGCKALTHVTIPKGTTRIPGSGFSGLNAKTISLPRGLTAIESSGFNQANIEIIAVPSTCTSIGNGSFNNCTKLKRMKVPPVTGTGNALPTFAYCESLRTLTFTSGVSELGNQFAYSAPLENFVIPDTVTTLGNNCFQGADFTSIEIPDSVKSIGTSCFSACRRLASVTLPSWMTELPNNIFSSDYSLRSVMFPEDITRIGNNAFSYCASLKTFTVPATVTSIGDNAFYQCSSLSEVHVLPTTPPTIGANAFAGVASGTKIYVPAASLEAYKTAQNWSTYASYMVGE